MQKLLLLLVWAFFASVKIFAQDVDIQLNHLLYHYMDRLDIKGLTDTTIHTDIKPYGRADFSAAMKSVDLSQLGSREKVWHTNMRILADDDFVEEETHKGLWNTFYTNQRDIYRVRRPDFSMYINPVVHFAGGMDRNDYPGGFRPNLPLSINTRGLSVRGSLLNKIGFYTEVTENLTRFPQFIYNGYAQTDLLYGEALTKPFGTESGIDYLGSKAYLTFKPLKYIRVKAGKDRAFWGNGYQSPVLSDHAADYLFLTLTTRIWKLEYVNHFMQLVDYIPGKVDSEGAFPRKYGAFHQLSFKPIQGLSVGFFESVIFSPFDSFGKRGFEWHYLNPLIFYRSIEQYIGSPDNGTLGIHLKANFLQRFQFYFQGFLDDYKFSERNNGKGYWQNKYAIQSGLKYIDAFGISLLDLQLEYNLVRPYTYQHFNLASNYTHYGQILGHAAGANLYDVHFILRYHPFAKWNVYLAISQLTKGLDVDDINYGGDAAAAERDRPGDFDHQAGQGAPWKVQQAFFQLSRQIGGGDVQVELEARIRRENEQTSMMALLGLRMNLLSKFPKF